MISTITASQGYRTIALIIRKQITDLFVYRLRNTSDLDAITEELSAAYGKKIFQAIYEEAVKEPFSFLYVNLMEKDKKKMFMERFSKYLIPS